MSVAVVLLLAHFASATGETAVVVDPKAASAASEASATLTQKLSSGFSRHASLEVLGSEDLRALVDLAAEQQRLGCDEAAEDCLAEMGDALGARFVVTSRMGRVGSIVSLQVSILDVEKAAPIGRQSVEGDTVDAVVRQIPWLTDELAPAVTAAAARAALPAESSDTQSPASTEEPSRESSTTTAARAKMLVLDVQVDPTLFSVREEGLSWIAILPIQAVIGVVGALVLAFPPLSFFFMPCAPVLVTVLQGMVGDAFGRERSALAWPALYASVVSFVLAGIPNVFCTSCSVLFFVAFFVPLILGIQNGTLDADTIDTDVYLAENPVGEATPAMFTIAAAGGSMWLAVVNIFAFTTAPIVYTTFAEPKEWNDAGDGFPGVFSPGHQDSSASLPPSSSKRSLAMAY
jgi:hypothetical protein